MNNTIKKICILLAALVILEIPALLLWNRVRELEAELAATETTPETTVLPETTEATVPPETTVPQTLPPETEPPKITMDAVPQYYQNDYPGELYLTGTVATSGSSMTALAMVATYLTDHAFYPDEMADMLAHFKGGNYQRLEYGNDLLQLQWKRAQNIHESVEAVREGKTVIVMLNGENLFTWKEHYVVLTGINEEGKLTFLDTDSSHLEKDWLKKYYEEGLTEKDILRGYSCGWIYDKEAMPDEPFIYEPEPPAPESRYPGLELTAEEKLLMANLICMEAGSEPFEGQQAVAEVILNRLKSGRFQSSIYNIIHAPDQFAAVPYLYMAEPDYTQYKAIEQAQYGPYVLPEDVVFYAKFKVNDKFWGQIGDHYFCYSY